MAASFFFFVSFFAERILTSSCYLIAESSGLEITEPKNLTPRLKLKHALNFLVVGRLISRAAYFITPPINLLPLLTTNQLQWLSMPILIICATSCLLTSSTMFHLYYNVVDLCVCVRACVCLCMCLFSLSRHSVAFVAFNT